MKVIISLMVMFLTVFVVKSDSIPINGLTIEANGMRAGDKLTRINMPYRNILTSDTLVKWNFAVIKLSDKETETIYNEIDSNIVVENENRETRMFYIDSENQSLLRHYRGGMDIKYLIAENIKYPILCGSSKYNKFFGEGQIGSASYIKTAGFTSVSADRVGDLITPDEDTIKNVMRVKYHRSGITHIDNGFSRSFGLTRDSALFSKDSISHWLAKDSITHTIDKLQWYARGYRYPVVEMRKYKTYLYGIPSDSIEMALYYPLNLQVEEITNDEINQSYRENGTEGYNLPSISTFGGDSGSNKLQNKDNDDISGNLSFSAFSCEVYPSVTESDVKIRLYSDLKQNVVCNLISSSGILLWSNEVKVSMGYNEIICPMEYLNTGIYFVTCSNGYNTVSTKVVKKE